MASPQKEHGDTGISNELLEALVFSGLTGKEWDVVALLMRKTYGTKDPKRSKSDPDRRLLYAEFSSKYVSEMTGIDASAARKTIAGLIKRRIIRMISPPKGPRPAVLGIQKDYEQWLPAEVVTRVDGIPANAQDKDNSITAGHCKSCIQDMESRVDGVPASYPAFSASRVDGVPAFGPSRVDGVPASYPAFSNCPTIQGDLTNIPIDPPPFPPRKIDELSEQVFDEAHAILRPLSPFGLGAWAGKCKAYLVAEGPVSVEDRIADLKTAVRETQAVLKTKHLDSPLGFAFSVIRSLWAKRVARATDTRAPAAEKQQYTKAPRDWKFKKAKEAQ